jgi:hypothetical protein
MFSTRIELDLNFIYFLGCHLHAAFLFFVFNEGLFMDGVGYQRVFGEMVYWVPIVPIFRMKLKSGEVYRKKGLFWTPLSKVLWILLKQWTKKYIRTNPIKSAKKLWVWNERLGFLSITLCLFHEHLNLKFSSVFECEENWFFLSLDCK